MADDLAASPLVTDSQEIRTDTLAHYIFDKLNQEDPDKLKAWCDEWVAVADKSWERQVRNLLVFGQGVFSVREFLERDPAVMDVDAEMRRLAREATE